MTELALALIVVAMLCVIYATGQLILAMVQLTKALDLILDDLAWDDDDDSGPQFDDEPWPTPSEYEPSRN